MDEVLFRTALSPGIREQHDEFPLIGDPEREDGGRPVRTVHPGLPRGLRRHRRGGRRPADVRPVRLRRRDQPRQRLADRRPDLPRGPRRRMGVDVRAHVRRRRQDAVRRCRPTPARSTRRAWSSRPSSSTSKGVLNEDALRIILNQVRMPDWNRADLNGLVAACRTASRRVVEMCERFGTATYLSALDALLQRNYDAMKVLLSMVFEEGRTLSFTDYICDDGVGNGPYELKLSLTRTGEKVHLDFTGSLSAGGGADQLLHQREPDADVLRDLHDHRGRPADPLERRLLPAGRRHDPRRLVLEAQAPGLAQRPQPRHRAGVRPVRRAARADQPGPAQRGGLLLARRTSCTPGTTPRASAKGEWFQLYSIGFGGIPGRPLGDGPDGHSLWPSFVNIPCEYLESYYPLRIEKWETIADTGGAGLHRGGNGVDVAYVFEEPGEIAIHDDRWLTYPWGVNGGAPGSPRHQVARPRRRHPHGAAAASATTFRCGPATSCTSSPGAAAGGATRSNATPRWWNWRCGAGSSPRRGRGATAWSWATRRRPQALRDRYARRPARRAPGVRHGPTHGGDPGELRGGDGPPRPEAPGVGVTPPDPRAVLRRRTLRGRCDDAKSRADRQPVR